MSSNESYCDVSLSLALCVIFASLLAIVFYLFSMMCHYKTTNLQRVLYAEAFRVIQYRRLKMPLVAQWHHDRFATTNTSVSDDVTIEFEDDVKAHAVIDDDDSQLDAI